MNATLQALALRREAEAVKAEWDGGAAPDARAALARRPELRADRAVVLDLAFEEYCRRYESGERPDLDAYCDRFPTYRQSLRRQLFAHQYIEDNADRLAKAPPVRWPVPGERLGAFRLGRELGRGAIARVYLAWEESAGDRPVVVKVSAEGAAEGWTLGRLVHPNIVPVFSVRFEEGAGLTAVCMPFLGAATLTDVLDASYPTADAPPPREAGAVGRAIRDAARPGDPPLPAASDPRPGGSYTEAVVRLAVQVADALVFLHAEGVCHRDLKPSNVLLSPDGRARLLDFNLSADARAAAPALGGTFPYTAPEQLYAVIIDAEGDTLDERVDLFSLGAMLYELLTGRQPFGGPPAGKLKAAAAEMFARHRTPRIPLRALNPSVDRGLARLVERCLAFEPSARPASAAAVAAELRRYLAFPARLRRLVARKPWAAAAMGGLMLLAAGGAAREVASREPAAVGEYRQGREAFADGDDARAAESFKQALQDWPGDAKPPTYYLAHAAALLRQNEEDGDRNKVNSAEQDLIEANHLRSDGRTMALIGYCSSRLRLHDVAIEWYDKAVAAGFASPGLYNNRAVDRMQFHLQLSPAELERVRRDLDEAVRLDPDLQPARYNRVLLAISRQPPVRPPPLPDSVLDDVQRAAETGPGSQELYQTAAHLFAAAARRDGPADPKGRAAQALRCLRKAVDCGLNPERIGGDADFETVLKPLPGYAALLAAPPGPAGPETAARLVNPAPGLPE